MMMILKNPQPIPAKVELFSHSQPVRTPASRRILGLFPVEALGKQRKIGPTVRGTDDHLAIVYLNEQQDELSDRNVRLHML